MTYRIFLALGVVALIVGTLVIDWQQQAGIRPPANGARDTDLGYSARDAEIIETGEDGRPLYTVNADLIRQRPQDGVVLLDIVRMQFRDAAAGTWDLRAARGEIRRETGLVELFGDVRLIGALAPEEGAAPQPARIETQALALDTRTEIITTAEPVQFEWSGQRMRAVGLEARLKEHHVRLESDVNGLFTP
jgi:LPS export ABC transporter protein LptC